MSDPGDTGSSARRSFLPYTYVVGRLLIVVPTLLIVVLLCAGFAGWGPGHRLHGAAAVPAANWVTGKQPGHHKRKKHHKHHKKHHHVRHERNKGKHKHRAKKQQRKGLVRR